MSIVLNLKSTIPVADLATMFDVVQGWKRVGRIDSANYGDGYDFTFRDQVPIRFYNNDFDTPQLSVEFDRFDETPRDLQDQARESFGRVLAQHQIEIEEERSNKTSEEAKP